MYTPQFTHIHKHKIPTCPPQAQAQPAQNATSGYSIPSRSALQPHPLAVFERIAFAENYVYSYQSPDELHINLRGHYRDYTTVLTWVKNTEHLDIYASFDNHTPAHYRDKAKELVLLLNSRLQSGHFDFWKENGLLMYRHALTLAGNVNVHTTQAMALLTAVLDALDRGYPAYQYVVWNNKTPEDALNASLLDRGETAIRQAHKQGSRE